MSKAKNDLSNMDIVLNPRQIEVVVGLLAGMVLSEIAEELGVSTRTIQNTTNEIRTLTASGTACGAAFALLLNHDAKNLSDFKVKATARYVGSGFSDTIRLDDKNE